MSADFDRTTGHVKATMLAGGKVPPMLMAYTADAVLAIPLATVVGKDGAMAIADMLEIYFLANKVTSYIVTFETTQADHAVVVAEVGRESRVVHVLEKRGDGTVVQTSESDFPSALKAEVLSAKILGLLPTDDCVAEASLLEVADWMVKSLGMRRLPAS